MRPVEGENDDPTGAAVDLFTDEDTALSRNLIDGTLMAPGNIYTFRIADAANHHLFDLKLGSIAVIFPMRRDKHAGLSPKAKEAFDKYSGTWLTNELGKGLDDQEAGALEKLKADSKHTIHSWSAEEIAKAKALLAPVVAKYSVKNDKGVNVYEETLAAIEAVRAGK